MGLVVVYIIFFARVSSRPQKLGSVTSKKKSATRRPRTNLSHSKTWFLNVLCKKNGAADLLRSSCNKEVWPLSKPNSWNGAFEDFSRERKNQAWLKKAIHNFFTILPAYFETKRHAGWVSSQARSGASSGKAFTHPNSSTCQISATSAGSTSASMILRALRAQDTRFCLRF
jgi:hypothetical protein